MKLTFGMSGLNEALRAATDDISAGIEEEVDAAEEGLKADLRQQTEDLLGHKVANAWRGRVYRNEGQASGPAAFVWSKAPRIIDFFSSSHLVTPLGEAFAIPTSNVPRGARGRRLTPIEVEARFNTELRVVPLKTGNLGLVMDLVGALSRRRGGFRAATAGRRSQGRKAQAVLMFVLIKGPIGGQQLIDVEGLANTWGAKLAGNIERRFER